MRYEFRVDGHVSEPVAKAFPELQNVRAARQTLFFGSVTDETQLVGLLGRFRDFGLQVDEMRQLPD
ncbi:hypothetical protein [Streptomyces sp. NPDC097981]|uniref:hypothetical protein n=1 Tax=Streptomyces sp. NPDC097981 TaxID=3155428 RepID=UPI0033347AC7